MFTKSVMLARKLILISGNDFVGKKGENYQGLRVEREDVISSRVPSAPRCFSWKGILSLSIGIVKYSVARCEINQQRLLCRFQAEPTGFYLFHKLCSLCK